MIKVVQNEAVSKCDSYRFACCMAAAPVLNALESLPPRWDSRAGPGTRHGPVDWVCTDTRTPQSVWNSSKDMCEQFPPEERGNRKMFQSSTLSDSVSEETSRQIGMAQVRRHLVRFSCQTYDCTCFCTWFLCLSSAYLSETKGNKEPEQFWKRAGCKFKGIYIYI